MQTASSNHNDILIAVLTDGGKRPLPFMIHDGTIAVAYVNHGRWVADCPECNGAEIIAQGQTMLCGSCGAEHQVDFPDKPTREGIVAALTVRKPSNQNWYPHEQVTELVAQNIDHGIYPEDM